MSALTWSLASYTCAGKNTALIDGVSLVGVCGGGVYLEGCANLMSKGHNPLSLNPLRVTLESLVYPYL